jgi:RNA polymerase sigma factor (TIGR02999 family)
MSSAQLLPIVYEELRHLAAARLAQDGQRQFMQPTSLVHAAYVRLVGSADSGQPTWDNKGHFFAAAATAMRRILVDQARRVNRIKHGGGWRSGASADALQSADHGQDDIIEIDAALSKLESFDPDLFQVVMLRYFAGLSIESTALVMGVAPVTIKRRWTVARLWLLERIDERAGQQPDSPNERQNHKDPG